MSFGRVRVLARRLLAASGPDQAEIEQTRFIVRGRPTEPHSNGDWEKIRRGLISKVGSIGRPVGPSSIQPLQPVFFQSPRLTPDAGGVPGLGASGAHVVRFRLQGPSGRGMLAGVESTRLRPRSFLSDQGERGNK